MAEPASTHRHILKFVLPPSLGRKQATDGGRALEAYLSRPVGKHVEVTVAPSYEALSKDLLAGRMDAAWAPPYVCARVESMGARILVRGVRGGASTYRAALVCLADKPVTLESLSGKKVAWVDQDSVAGFLLPVALLKSKHIEPAKTFASKEFAGSYRAALEAVATGRADVTSIFARAAKPGHPDETGISDIAPELASRFKVVAFTEEAPNDGVAVPAGADPQTLQSLERALLSMAENPEGAKILHDTFRADGFEPAPKMAYRALYRVALSTL